MKKRLLAGAALTMLMSLSMMAGATYALFTSESTHDITVQAGKVNVKSTIVEESLLLNSMEESMPGNSFANGGTVRIVDNNILLDKMTPGDKLTIDVNIKNLSTVKAFARMKVQCKDGFKLFGRLKVAFDGVGPWKMLEPSLNPELEVGENHQLIIELPKEAGNEYQGLSTSISLIVEAFQGNADLPIDSTIESFFNDDTGSALVEKENPKDLVIDTSKGAASVYVPSNRVSPTANKVELNVKTKSEPDSNFRFTNDVDAKYYDINVTGINEESGEIVCELFIGRGLKNVKAYHNHNGAKLIHSEYNPETGFIKFNTNNFSVFAFTATKETPKFDLEFVPEVLPTKENPKGNISYWKSNTTNKFYADELGKKEISKESVVTTYYLVKTLGELDSAVKKNDNPYIYIANDLNYKDYVGKCSVNVTSNCTIDGSNYSIIGNANRFAGNTVQDAIIVNNGNSKHIDVTFKNLTIKTNKVDGARCIDTRGNLNSITLENVNLFTDQTSIHGQPLSIGGAYQDWSADINIINSSITSDKSGYCLTSFNPINMNSIGSTFTGWAAANMKDYTQNSNLNFVDSTLNCDNYNSGSKDAYSAICLEEGGINVVLDNVKASCVAKGEAPQCLLMPSNIAYGKENGFTLIIKGDSDINGKIIGANDWAENVQKITLTGGTYTDSSVNNQDYLPTGYKCTTIGEAETLRYIIKEVEE